MKANTDPRYILNVYRMVHDDLYRTKEITGLSTEKIIWLLRQVNIDAIEIRRQKVYTLRQDGLTLDEIGKRFHLSRQRVHQIIQTIPLSYSHVTDS